MAGGTCKGGLSFQHRNLAPFYLPAIKLLAIRGGNRHFNVLVGFFPVLNVIGLCLSCESNFYNIYTLILPRLKSLHGKKMTGTLEFTSLSHDYFESHEVLNLFIPCIECIPSYIGLSRQYR